MGYRGSVGESARLTCDELEDEMAYVIAVQAGQSVLPGPPKTTEFEVEVEL
jgi:hypothetical protein